MAQQIILRNLQRPKEIDLTDDIGWLGETLGFDNGRDIEHMANQILACILNNAREPVSTEVIANKLEISNQRVNYHVRTFIDAGFIRREKKLICLRQGSAKAAIEEMRRDANRIFDNLSRIAEEIDNELGLRNR